MFAILNNSTCHYVERMTGNSFLPILRTLFGKHILSSLTKCKSIILRHIPYLTNTHSKPRKLFTNLAENFDLLCPEVAEVFSYH